uniref:RRM domain-containing protein n=1 Tax=Sphaeramia orbicularis TaxID=375764 RepID=A0A672YHD2_9TELE
DMDVETTAKRRICISMPKKHMASFAKIYELDHGLVVKELNPYLNEGYIQAYFREWGTVTYCKVRRKNTSIISDAKAVAYVRFCAEDEADRADWAGPHFIGGSEVEVRRVVSPKVTISTTDNPVSWLEDANDS